MKRFYQLLMKPYTILLLLSSSTFAQVSVTVKTTTYLGAHSPENVYAIWIENQSSELVKTLGCAGYSDGQLGMIQKLKNYMDISDGIIDTIDCITEATRENHNDSILVTWNLKNFDGDSVSNSTYVFKLEMTEDDYMWSPQEPYLGRITNASVAIDGQTKTVNGDVSDEAFEFFKIVYTSPIDEIISNSKISSRSGHLSYWYNPSTPQLIIQLNSFPLQSAQLYIMNLKGRIIKILSPDIQLNRFTWNMQDSNGKPIPSGLYIFEIRNNTQRINKVQTITIFR